MDSYNGDSTIPAVILYDYGYFNGNTFNFTRQLRIKILKKEGYNWANQKFYTKYKADVKGTIFYLQNEEIIQEKIRNKDIYKERLSSQGSYAMNITFPNVKVGAVIDIEYSFIGFPSEWKFQSTIPVQWSELILEPTTFVSFRKKLFGFEPLDIQTETRWVARNVPAFKEEPFINSIENYITKFEFDILKLHRGGITKSITTNWEDFSDFLLDYGFFGDELAGSGFLRQSAKTIKENNRTETQKVEAAFYETKSVKWNGEHAIHVDVTDLKFVWNNKIGNSADINIILLKLLERLDIECKPVVLSTRDNGIISVISPSLNRLNHVIVYAIADGKEYLLDATEDYMPFDLLPEKCLNWQGFIVDRDNSSWVYLQTSNKDKQLAYYDLKLTDKIKLEGTMSYLKEDYAAYNFRKNFHKNNSEQSFLDDFLTENPGLKIIKSEIKNIDSLSQPIEEIFEVSINEHIEEFGDEIAIYPLFYQRENENPFKLEERSYPIDFAYKSEKNVIVNLEIPENMEFIEIPEPTKVSLPDNAGYFMYQCVASGKKLNLSYKYAINKELFDTSEYATLKEFINQVIITHSKPVIIKNS